MSLAYTPGVAEPCVQINKDYNKSFELTGRGNLVAVITDGTAVLGLGDIGPEAGMPVMEGKCALFTEFADVDAAIVGTHMMMEIQDLGLATTWVGHFKSQVMVEQFPMMEGHNLIAIFPVGYAAEDAKPIDMHFERKAVETLVTRL